MMQISVGTTNWKHGWIKDPLHPLFGMIVGSGYYGAIRAKLSSANVGYGFCALVLFLWLLAGDPLINTVILVVATCYGTYALNQPLSL